jgi:hypothetical protein
MSYEEGPEPDTAPGALPEHDLVHSGLASRRPGSGPWAAGEEAEGLDRRVTLRRSAIGSRVGGGCGFSERVDSLRLELTDAL